MRFLWNLAIASWMCAQLTSLGVAQVRDSSVEELIQRFDEKEVERRRDAAYELVRRGDHSDAVIAALGKASNDDDVQVRVQSLTGLARAGKKSEPVIPELLKCLRRLWEPLVHPRSSRLHPIGRLLPTMQKLRRHRPLQSLGSKRPLRSL